MMTKSFWTSSSVSEEVGSSMTMTFALKATDLAISTICFSLMLRSPTLVVGLRFDRLTFLSSSSVRAFISA